MPRRGRRYRVFASGDEKRRICLIRLYLTPREYLRIHGYPDNYRLRGPIRGRSGTFRHLDQHRQVAKGIAEAIARTLECPDYSQSLVIL